MTTTTDAGSEPRETTNRIRVTYTPEGAEPKVWTFDPERLLLPECTAIERATGLDYGSTFLQAFGRRNMAATQALLWVLLKREQPTLKLAEVQFTLAEVQLDDPDLDGIEDETDDDPLPLGPEDEGLRVVGKA